MIKLLVGLLVLGSFSAFSDTIYPDSTHYIFCNAAFSSDQGASSKSMKLVFDNNDIGWKTIKSISIQNYKFIFSILERVIELQIIEPSGARHFQKGKVGIIEESQELGVISGNTLQISNSEAMLHLSCE